MAFRTLRRAPRALLPRSLRRLRGRRRPALPAVPRGAAPLPARGADAGPRHDGDRLDLRWRRAAGGAQHEVSAQAARGRGPGRRPRPGPRAAGGRRPDPRAAPRRASGRAGLQPGRRAGAPARAALGPARLRDGAAARARYRAPGPPWPGRAPDQRRRRLRLVWGRPAARPAAAGRRHPDHGRDSRGLRRRPAGRGLARGGGRRPGALAGRPGQGGHATIPRGAPAAGR